MLFQPPWDDLAANVTEIVMAKPLNETIELAGPDAIPFDSRPPIPRGEERSPPVVSDEKPATSDAPREAQPDSRR